MKFSEMPYERIDFDAAKEELSSIIKAFSGSRYASGTDGGPQTLL